MTLNDVSEVLNDFKQVFPPPPFDSDIRASYRGGFTYCNPKYQGKIYGKGIVYDVNSLYPFVMHERFLPYGNGVPFKGKYQKDKVYPLYIQMFRCKFKLKPNHLPTIQIKNNLSFIPNEYITDSGEEEPVLVLTSVDMKLFRDHYDFLEENVEYMGGYKFMAAKGLFNDYIDYWMSKKIEAEKEGNKPLRQLCKLMLNALYGKFGLNTNGSIKEPRLIDDKVNYTKSIKKSRNPIYLPVATFVTAWARYHTITAAQANYDRFMYADTDSLHLRGWEPAKNITVDPYALGAWKEESKFTKCKFLRQKAYLELIDNKIHVKCAGMPNACHKYVTFDNFKVYSTFPGKLKPVSTVGGVVLVPTPFTIKP